MMSNCNEEKQWSGKKMEGGEALKTLDCLRGRLLAERQASRSAKEEAEFMGKKLIELENQIRKETELRNKAEKRLKLLIKKLESLNIASISMISENSTSSEISTNSSATKETEDQESKSEENRGEIAASNQNAPDRTNSSPNTESPKSSCTDLHRSSQISRSKDQSFSVEVKERESEHYIDNPVASVAGAAPAASSESRAMMKSKAIIQERARDVRDAVKKHIRRNVQSSFERRNHMKAIMSM